MTWLAMKVMVKTMITMLILMITLMMMLMMMIGSKYFAWAGGSDPCSNCSYQCDNFASYHSNLLRWRADWRLQPGGAKSPACTTFHPYYTAAVAGLKKNKPVLKALGLADREWLFWFFGRKNVREWPHMNLVLVSATLPSGKLQIPKRVNWIMWTCVFQLLCSSVD